MFDNYRSLSNITGHCPTNQCSWQRHTTLAICSSVEDISSTVVEFSTGHSSVQALKDVNLAPPSLSEGNQPTFWAESLYLPSTKVGRTNPSQVTQANGNGMPSLAEVYVVYYPACNGTSQLSSNGIGDRPELWRAFKGTLSLCMLSLESNTTNGKTNTTIENEWKDIFERVDTDLYCAQVGQEPRSCVDATQWSTYGQLIAQGFNAFAYFEVGEDNYIYDEAAVTLASDILGIDPTGCSSLSLTTDQGLKGLGMRVKNVATSMTNA
jgi:hypothetical protein